MSSSSSSSGRGRGRPYHAQRGGGGGGGGQKRFAPKRDISSPSPTPAKDQPPPPISSSARHPRPRLTAPLRTSDGVTFVDYLPQDEALASGIGAGSGGGLDAVESQAVVDVLNDELSWLLKLGPRDFWREVARNDSLRDSLDSYLKFRHRWYDFPHRGADETVAGVLVGENDLSRRVFMTFYRMSSNRDPGSSAHDCLSAKEHAALLQEKKLLDLPKLLDICGIYGHDNEELTRVLVNNAVKVQPFLAENFTGIFHHFLGIADTMHQRCVSSVELLVDFGGHVDHALDQFRADLLEVMDFINDAIVTLDAFVSIYKPAAMFFSFPIEISDRNEDLLTMLRKLHDSLLPSLHQGFTLMSSNGGKRENSNNSKVKNVALSLKLISRRIVNFGWKLLETCYLSDDFFEDVSLPQTMKLFPAKVDDPVTRGDIFVQTFREINKEAYEKHVKIQEYGTFLQNIEKQFFLLSRIDSLRSNGWIFLDDIQFHNISQIIMLSADTWGKDSQVQVSSIIETLPIDEDAVIMESKISQIKDLFPDYGQGFLSACLDVYNQDPEEVIQRILDETLHEDLLSLDTSLEQKPPPKTASMHINGKGKGAVMESKTEYRSDKGKGLLVDSPAPVTGMSSASLSVDKRVVTGPSLSSASSNGWYTRKPKDEPAMSEVLDSKSAKDLVRSMVLAAREYEDEYDDEYDDSFDDLGLSVVESGTEEVENLGEGTNSLPGKSWGSENQSSKSNSRWGSQKKPQFYVKDGKNYSYKVSGSVAVQNAQEAAMINQTQKDMIHGLGRGGNVPIEAARNYADSRKLMDSNGEISEDSNPLDGGGRGRSNLRGRGGRRGGSQYRKNQAMRKHFAGLTGY